MLDGKSVDLEEHTIVYQVSKIKIRCTQILFSKVCY